MPDPGVGSVAAALRVTAEVYQPFSPDVPLRLPLMVGGLGIHAAAGAGHGGAVAVAGDGPELEVVAAFAEGNVAAAGPGAGKAFAIAGTFDGEDAVAAEGFTAADVENGRADAPAVLAGSGAGDGAADGGRGQGGAVFDHDGGTGLIPQRAALDGA